MACGKPRPDRRHPTSLPADRTAGITISQGICLVLNKRASIGTVPRHSVSRAEFAGDLAIRAHPPCRQRIVTATLATRLRANPSSPRSVNGPDAERDQQKPMRESVSFPGHNTAAGSELILAASVPLRGDSINVTRQCKDDCSDIKHGRQARQDRQKARQF